MSLFRPRTKPVVGLLARLALSSAEAGCICNHGLTRVLVGNLKDLSYAIWRSSYSCLQGLSISSWAPLVSLHLARRISTYCKSKGNSQVYMRCSNRSQHAPTFSRQWTDCKSTMSVTISLNVELQCVHCWLEVGWYRLPLRHKHTVRYSRRSPGI